MNQSPLLEGKRVLLRKPVRQDVEDRMECGRHPEIVRMYGGDTRNMMPLTKDEVISWYDKVSSTRYVWMIEYKGECIGTARLTVNEQDRRARYAVGMFDISKLGLGLGTEATQLVLQYAFEA
jgi:RimJ/RimL family protein N-acetyltransferase